MNVALYTSAIREPSFTHGQVPPDSFRYTNWDDPAPDVVLCTPELRQWCLTNRLGWDIPLVLWIQEANFLVDQSQIKPIAFKDFDLVLSNNSIICDNGATYMTLWGTWINDWTPSTKTKLCSAIFSDKRNTATNGYAVRRKVRALATLTNKIEGFGHLFSKYIQRKEDGMIPFMFHVAVENENYPHWHTEKLFDCFATRSVPLYWGCNDPKRLDEKGYDTKGIIYWNTIPELESILGTLSPELYESMSDAIENNYQVTKRLYCAEVELERIFKETIL